MRDPKPELSLYSIYTNIISIHIYGDAYRRRIEQLAGHDGDSAEDMRRSYEHAVLEWPSTSCPRGRITTKE